MSVSDVAILVCALFYLITLAWPVNVPVMALAYKYRHGRQPIPLSAGELWGRSAIAALVLGAMSLVPLLGAYLVLEDSTAAFHPCSLLPYLLLIYLPIASYFVRWVFYLEEAIEGFSLVAVYLA